MSIVQARQKIGQKSTKERSNGNGRFILRCSLELKDAPKLLLSLYLMNKKHIKNFRFI